MSQSSGLLDRIVDAKKREIESIGEFDLDLYGLEGGLFKKALVRKKGSSINVIAECKKRSPSSGLIRSVYNPELIAAQYKRLGASAVSVLTDAEFFEGDSSHIGLAKKSGLPVLRKDFVISPRQIFQARYLGADAVLLIVRILDDFQLRDFIQIAESVKLGVLVEIHNQIEMDRALKAGTEIFGINHRDLDTLKMDLSLTGRLAAQIRNGKKDAVIVAESGVESREGRLAVDEYADAILIGTALMKSENLDFTWNEIFS